jgi:hypothetical protein
MKRSASRLLLVVLAAGLIAAAAAVSALAVVGKASTSGATKPVVDGRALPYDVDIQATYSRRGQPALTANFAPDGGLAKPRWSICRGPDPTNCRRAASRSQFLDPGPTQGGTVFRASAAFRGKRYVADSAAWQGSLHATGRPSVQGTAAVGDRVAPTAGSWAGGWQAGRHARHDAGSSGGREPDFDQLNIEACRSRRARHCVDLTAPAPDRAHRSTPPIPSRFAGWYLFAVDQRLAGDTVFALPGYQRPEDIPPARHGATVAFSDPSGPVRRH